MIVTTALIQVIKRAELGGIWRERELGGVELFGK